MTQISASLLAADFARLGEEVLRADKAGADAFHFDMMDGHYVPNIAFAPEHLSVLRKYTKLPFHLHLELGNPDFVLENFPKLDADLILVQWDTLVDPARTFARIKALGARVGLSLNPADEITEIESCLPDLDTLLLLSVNPGFGGQPMMTGINERAQLAKKMLQSSGSRAHLAVDGGVTRESAGGLIRAGVEWLIIGTALFSQPDMAGYIRDIKQPVESY